ncbi:hypothetical protein CIY_27450 [Butyrivibrio fibrisolvens 16/4]|nr:hypothetical protein CIY_27450 [Butyrivibrio fibrisolvens 16/4]
MKGERVGLQLPKKFRGRKQ